MLAQPLSERTEVGRRAKRRSNQVWPSHRNLLDFRSRLAICELRSSRLRRFRIELDGRQCLCDLLKNREGVSFRNYPNCTEPAKVLEFEDNVSLATPRQIKFFVFASTISITRAPTLYVSKVVVAVPNSAQCDPPPQTL